MKLTAKLTEKKILSLPVPEQGQDLTFDPGAKGLAVKVLASGQRSFICRFTIEGRRFEKVLGPAGSVPGALALDTARLMAAERMKEARQVRHGEKSLYEVVKGKAAANATSDPTVSQLITEYIESHGKLRPVTRLNYERIRDNWLGAWKDRPAKSIDRKEGITLLNDLKAKKSPDTALTVARLIKAVWRWADDEYAVGVPPVWTRNQWPVPKRRGLGTAQPKDLIPAIWAGVQKFDNPTRRDFWMLMLLTGQRPSALASLKWENVDLKNGLVHHVSPKGGETKAFVAPLSKRALQILKLRREVHPEAEWVFPARSKSGHLEVFKQKGFGFQPTVCRRIFATVGSAATSAYNLKWLLNHALPRQDVTGGYITADLDALRKAQQAIEDRLLKLTKASVAKAA